MKKLPPTWNSLTPELRSAFLMGDTISPADWYIDGINVVPETYTAEGIERFINCAKQKKVDYGCYGDTDPWLYEALDSVPIKDMSVAIMGSTRPWYEAITIANGGHPTVLEYQLPNYNYPLIKEVLLKDALSSNLQFDMGISISSFEHDGLGRYGDPVDPDGDIRAMQEMKKLLKPNGFLFLAVPMGDDKMVWNAHRIYGHKRMKKLLAGWEIIGAVGYDEINLMVDTGIAATYQPVIVLQNV